MTPSIMLIWLGAFFAMVIIGAIALFVLGVFYTYPSTAVNCSAPAATNGIFTDCSYAANATHLSSQGLYNFFDQMPNVGKLAGVTLIIGVLALMGMGGYVGYTKLRG